MERTRFLSLDVFRGMALCLMIVVNTPGAGSHPYPILDHAEWFGFTLADAVFPSFPFAVGNAMAFGAGTKTSEAEFWRKTVRRTAIIIALGVLTFGAALIVLALLWGTVFPIGKKLWTSSFVLFTVGIALILLAGLMAWIDIGGRKFGVRFFEIFGRNPILLYVVAILIQMALNLIRIDGAGLWSWFGQHAMQALAPGPNGSLLTAIFYMLLCWLVALWLYRRKIVFRI